MKFKVIKKRKILLIGFVAVLVGVLLACSIMSAFAVSGEVTGSAKNYQKAVIAWSYTDDVTTMKTSVTVQLKVLNAKNSQAYTSKNNAPYHIQLTSNTSGTPTEKDGKFDYTVAGKGKYRTITGAKITNKLNRTSGATKKVNFSGYIDLSSGTITGKLSVSGSITLPAITKPTKSVSGTITWNDDNNRDGIRPASVTATCNNGGGSKSVSAAAGSVSFSGLAKYNASGTEISYGLSWSAVSGYTQNKVGNNITYTHTPYRTSHGGSVVWNDDNNRDGLRPTSVAVQLLKNGAVNTSVNATATGNWAYSFTNLYQREGGSEIKWTSRAVAPTGYTASGTTLSHTPQTKTISGSIVWQGDQNNKFDSRPDSVEITLLKNGTKATSVTTDASKNWNYSFENQYVNESGSAISYVIQAPEVDIYEVKVSGTTVTYSYFSGHGFRFGFGV